MKAFLVNARREALLSQGDVAKKLGYTSPQFVSNWERGLSTPPINTIKKLAKIYRIDAKEMFIVYRETAHDKLDRAIDKELRHV